MTTRSRRYLVVALAVIAGLLVVAGGVVLALALTPDSDVIPAAQTSPEPTAAPSTPTAASSAPVVEVRVADLMRRLGCAGNVIGTQLYSKETGRCTLAGVEVTIAVFDSDALRDQWVGFARQYGGNFATGARWAAATGSPDTAATVAQKLGGQRA